MSAVPQTKQLAPGDRFPALTVSLVGGATLELPLNDHYTVVLLFRGAWCPYCNAQLRTFERAHERLESLGVRVAAVSVDDEATTSALIAKHGLRFPVGHSADAWRLQQRLGAFVNAEPEYLQSTGFLVDPSGRVIVSVYSSGAIGRLLPDDVIGLVRHLQAQEREAA